MTNNVNSTDAVIVVITEGERSNILFYYVTHIPLTIFIHRVVNSKFLIEFLTVFEDEVILTVEFLIYVGIVVVFE